METRERRGGTHMIPSRSISSFPPLLARIWSASYICTSINPYVQLSKRNGKVNEQCRPEVAYLIGPNLREDIGNACWRSTTTFGHRQELEMRTSPFASARVVVGTGTMFWFGIVKDR